MHLKYAELRSQIFIVLISFFKDHDPCTLKIKNGNNAAPPADVAAQSDAGDDKAEDKGGRRNG